ncbi:uncharacterized protein J4E92_001119 [Alternaria infectoria]|uniref:uncharacterized protein n=1 Tax=Alternaria infectoria TaxID=45303 RepID=UPI00221F5584|nr:uncharacterized protein J4E92_001119 [Alternaria infectoria]KAI4939833.1 hypothetical protein J4E92_001119 [Alternaria infectoria]
MADRMLRPDTAIISAIFTESQPNSIEILAHSFTNCTFKAEFPNRPAVIVRLDTASGSLAVVSEIQEAASLQIPTYVPEILSYGKVVTENQSDMHYMVTRFITETVTLESVWTSLNLTQKTSLVDAVANAVDKLQQLDTSHALLQQILPNTALDAVANSRDISIGSSFLGFAKSVREFIALYVAKRQAKRFATSSIEDALDGDGIVIRSALPELGDIHLSSRDLGVLETSLVLSHNDLEPRNLLVKKAESEDGPQYELAAIIDWEMAGLLPSAFETAVKDVSLGSNNQYLDYYLMFKEKTRSTISGGESSEKLIKAIRLIDESWSQQMKRNVGAETRKRWISREGLELSEDAFEGWIMKPARDGTKREMRSCSKADNKELEDQVLRDFGML